MSLTCARTVRLFGLAFRLRSARPSCSAHRRRSKLLLGSVDPWLLAGILYLGAGLGPAGIHFGRLTFKLPQVEAPLRKGDLPWLAAVVVIGGCCSALSPSWRVRCC